MRKILIVGEFNARTKDVSGCLSPHFSTQLCTNSGKILKSMLKMFNPELVLINIEGFGVEHNDVFMSCAEHNSQMPVITFGPDKIKQIFISFYYGGQCRHVNAPASNEDILKAICEEFNMDAMVLIRGNETNLKKHVLVVDDNPVLLRNMKNMLQDKYKISLATSAAQCMKIIGSDCPDLVILDYEMPVVDGRQTLEMIRNEEEYKDIPVIFLTGIADKKHVDAVLELKPAGYFVKPPMQTRMIEAIDGILLK